MLEFQKPGSVSQSNAYVHICVLPISDIRILASCRPCLQRQHDAKLLGSEIVIYFFHVLYIDMVIGRIPSSQIFFFTGNNKKNISFLQYHTHLFFCLLTMLCHIA